jgi:energy-dependent translational throttle protein EttA
MVDRYNEVSNLLGEVTDDDEMNALLAEQAELQEKIDAVNAWELERTVDIAMDALRCPPGDADVTKLSGGERRRVALVPPAAAESRPAAARRADQPSRRRVRRLARALPARIHRHRRGRHPRPLFPRQCHRMDPRARPQQRHSLSGQLLVNGWSRRRSACRSRRRPRASRQKTLERELEWIQAARSARQAKSKARITAYENLLAESKDKAPEEMADRDRAGPAPRQPGHRGRGTQQRASATTASDRRPELQACRPAASSA